MRVLPVCCVLLAASAAFSQVTIDTFSEKSDTSLYPVMNSSMSSSSTSIEDTGLQTPISSQRDIIVRARGFNTGTVGATASVDITSSGLEFASTSNATGNALVGWISDDPNNHLNFDSSPYDGFTIAFSNVSAPLEMAIQVFNVLDGTPRDVNTGSWTIDRIPIQPGTNQYSIGFDQFEPQVGIPGADWSSIDAFGLSVFSESFGNSYSIDNFAIVPEPDLWALGVMGILTAASALRKLRLGSR